MKNKTIGIPRAFLYYKKHTLWKKFFKYLGYNIVISPSTNNDIKEITSIINSNISYNNRIYLGHIFYLFNKSNYIFIPKDKLYNEIIKIFPNIRILSYKERSITILEFFSFLKIGLKLTNNIFKIIYAYFKAKLKEIKSQNSINKNQTNLLYNTNKKILIISDYNIIYDKYIDDISYNYLKSKSIDIIYGNLLNKKIAKSYSKNIKNYIYNKFLTGSIFYYQSTIEGIIFLNDNNDIDSFMYEYNINKKYININLNKCDNDNYMINEIKTIIN